MSASGLRKRDGKGRVLMMSATAGLIRMVWLSIAMRIVFFCLSPFP
ncbi:hypothetical protein SAMN03159496_03087 [Rhizobium sp. NFR07]|nr:hypothetical protein SAMN03159496_03087 [Rhizobium sp. NFR07]